MKEIPEKIYYAIVDGRLKGPYEKIGTARGQVSRGTRGGVRGEVVELDLVEVERTPWPTAEHVKEQREKELRKAARRLEYQQRMLREREEMLQKELEELQKKSLTLKGQ